MLIAGGEAICRGADGWTRVLRFAELREKCGGRCCFVYRE